MARRLFLSTLMLAWVATAAPDDYFRAIRAGDNLDLQKLIREGNVNAADGRGMTPLHYAAAFGNEDSVRLLLAAGADAKARNAMQATPLVLAAHSPAKVRMLLAAGADVDAATKAGRTALIIAAGRTGGVQAVRMLVEAGADVNRGDERGITPLMSASWYGDLESVRFLLSRKADPKAVDKNGTSVLAGPLAIHEPERARILLNAGADVNVANTFANKVRHGNVMLTGLTPLLLAAADGPPEMIDLLIKAGAKVNVQDGRGMSPLMAAVSTEPQDSRVIQALIAAGAEVNAKDLYGETVLDWARKFNYPSTLRLLEAAGAKGSSSAPAPYENKHAAGPLDAVQRAMGLLQVSSTAFFKESGCVGCHHQPAIASAEARVQLAGLPVSDAARQEQVRGMNSAKPVEPVLLQFIDIGGEVDTVAAHLIGFSAAGVAPNSLTDAAVNYLAGKQDAGGAWTMWGIARRPVEGSTVVRTALVIKAIKDYSWPARKVEFDERIARARKWLLQAKPTTSYERAALLLGLRWSGAPDAVLAKVSRGLIREQRADGGWAQNPNLEPDAYATGVALCALRDTGQLKETDPEYRKGVSYLLRTQREDGSWYVRSHAPKFQPYFQSGFPYEHDQWISSTATAYAVMAIAPAASPSTVSRR